MQLSHTADLKQTGGRGSMSAANGVNNGAEGRDSKAAGVVAAPLSSKTPSCSSSPDTQLLFFDTFSHEVLEELNLDLVQFPSPVVVEEVRVIPLGAQVSDANQIVFCPF